MINIIAVIPTNLMPLPSSPGPTESSRRMPPRTNTYLLLPRAGAIMLSPVPSSACIEQAGPWYTAAVIEVREDGYLMEDIRALARSGRGIAAAATFLHPHMVNPMEYTETNVIASLHGDTATALYKEPVSIEAPMPRPSSTLPGQTHAAHDPTASPLSSHSSSASPRHSLGSQEQHQGGSATSDLSESTNTRQGYTKIPRSPLWEQVPITPTTKPTEPPDGYSTVQSQPTWFSHLAYPSESDNDTGEGDEDDMDTTQQPIPHLRLPTHLSKTS
jgi:hypothetical protein